MKKIFSIIIYIVGIVLLSSCGKSTPDTVAIDFTKAVWTGDFEKAKLYCTDDGKKIVLFMEEFVDAGMLETMKALSLEITGEEAVFSNDGAEAEVLVTAIGKDAFGEDGTNNLRVKLKKTDGRWLVDGAE